MESCRLYQPLPNQLKTSAAYLALISILLLSIFFVQTTENIWLIFSNLLEFLTPATPFFVGFFDERKARREGSKADTGLEVDRDRYLQERYNYYVRPDQRPADANNSGTSRYAETAPTNSVVNRHQQKKAAPLPAPQRKRYRPRTRRAKRRTNADGTKQNIIKTNVAFWVATIFALGINKLLFFAGVFLAVSLGAASIVANSNILSSIFEMFSNLLGYDVLGLFFILWAFCLILGLSMIVICLIIFTMSGMKAVGGKNSGIKYALLITAMIFTLFPVINLFTIVPTLLWAYVVKKYPA